MRRWKHLYPALALAACLSLPVALQAQDQERRTLSEGYTQPKAYGDVLKDPVCFKIGSDAPYTVYGTVVTNYYMDSRGIKARHRSNFHLKQNEETEFCTYGPFYEGQTLDLVLRTLIPVFTCRTKIDEKIMIHGALNADGTTKSWADCREPPAPPAAH